MRLFIIAGEASGDLHASNLIHELMNIDSSIKIQAWGGDLMEAAGAEIVKHYTELAFMGFAEVIMNLRTIKANFKKCRQDIDNFKPDVVLMIDYPGFNLRIAPFIKKKNIPIVYYISPQIWAWKQNRVHQIKKLVDKMLVILPFEQAFYKKFDVSVDFVGHPLIDAIHKDSLLESEKTEGTSQETSTNENDSLQKRKLIALLPGSRKQEIKKILPIMIEGTSSFTEYEIAIAGAPGISDDFYQEVIGKTNIKVSREGTYPLLKRAHAALVTSGTATLESALLKVPEVVCYKGNYLSYLIAKKLVKVKYISLVNLIMDKIIVKELIQGECNKELIKSELNSIISGVKRNEMLHNFDELQKKLGGIGASQKAANAVFKTLQNSQNRSLS